MLSCYTGDEVYTPHYDNPHRVRGEGNKLPDNGLRVTLCYYINPHWNPEGQQNDGGLDIFMVDPNEPGCSANAARKKKRLRVAPHADTLVIFLSDRMPHQVIQTRGKDKWFCLTMWGFESEVMNEFFPKVENMFRPGEDEANSDDD